MLINNMKKNPKVSIIIPVYKGKDYMREAIDSALNQTYKNIEIIVVNDGSDDGNATRNIALSYGDKIRYFEKENGGVSTALNLAIKNMKGDYFSWLSHDDRYYKNKISEQIEYLKQYDDETILYSDYDLMDENSNVFARSIKDHEELVNKPEYALLRGAINGITLLIPKKAFSDCGVFREDLRCTQDYELWQRMMKKYKFVHEPGVLATTRLHSNQTGNTSPRVLIENNELWLELIESISDERKIELEKSIYNYYYQMREFIKTTNFDEVLKYLNNKVLYLENQLKKIAKDTLVSVIIPFYNNNDELNRAVDSVLKQTHKKIEIIIVDDFSIDNIDSKFTKINNIKIIRNKCNSGVSFSRNVGIQNSKGKYLAFLDSDDEFVQNKIEEQLLYMLKYNSEFCYTSYIRKSNDIENPIDCSCDDNFLKAKCISNCLISTSTVMIKKDIIDKYNLKYNESIKYGEDVIFYLSIFKYVEPIYFNKYLSIVNSDDDSAYLNINKQVEGTKNILIFLLNDDYYQKMNNEIAKLCYGFYTLVNPNINEYNQSNKNGNNINSTRYVKQSKLKKYYNILKNKGFLYCINRFFKRMVGK